MRTRHIKYPAQMGIAIKVVHLNLLEQGHTLDHFEPIGR